MENFSLDKKSEYLKELSSIFSKKPKKNSFSPQFICALFVSLCILIWEPIIHGNDHEHMLLLFSLKQTCFFTIFVIILSIGFQISLFKDQFYIISLQICFGMLSLIINSVVLEAIFKKNKFSAEMHLNCLKNDLFSILVLICFSWIKITPKKTHLIIFHSSLIGLIVLNQIIIASLNPNLIKRY